MGNQLDMNLLTAYLKARRGDLGLREAAEQIGEISASTLSRIENGKIPDIDIFLRLCDWMGLPASMFLREPDQMTSGETPAVIEAHLRADKELDESTAEAIAKMVKAAYELGRRKRDAGT